MDQGEVCSLPPQDQQERVAMFRREILPRARAAERLPDGRAWRFPDDPALKARLEALVAFERGCCGGLDWNLDEAGGELRLRIEGIDPDADFFAPLAGDAGAGRATGARRAGIGGVLAGASALVACEIPWVLGAIGVGAAPFLDAFGVLALAGGATLVAGSLWVRQKRTRPM